MDNCVKDNKNQHLLAFLLLLMVKDVFTGVRSLVPYHPIWGNDVSRLVERQKFISVGLSKYVDF
jgi:hypothetical protein